ncbi:MAG TPA: hypothetical protein VJ724_06690, partial [Tahibacter sp.]|nr:hypothetical protein [Tahibacter sp.]
FAWRHAFFPSVGRIDGKPVLVVDDIDRTGNGVIRLFEWHGAGKLAALPYVAPRKRPPYPRADGPRLAKYPRLFAMADELVLFYADERPVVEHVTRDFRFRSVDVLADAGVINPVAWQAQGNIYAAWQDPQAGYAAVLRRYDGTRWHTLPLPHRPTRSLDPIYLFESAGYVYFSEGRKDGLELVLYRIGADGAVEPIRASGLARSPRYAFATLRGNLYAACVAADATNAVLSRWNGETWTNHAVPGLDADVRAVHLAADDDAGRLYLLYEYQRIGKDTDGRIRIDHRMRAAVATP